MVASMPPHGPAPGRATVLPFFAVAHGQATPFVGVMLSIQQSIVDAVHLSLCHDSASEGRAPKHDQSTKERFSFSYRLKPEVLARVSAWDLTRHGCRVRAYGDVLAACPMPVRVQAPSVNEAFARNRQTSCVGLIDVAPRSHSSRLLIGKQAFLEDVQITKHQTPKRPADHSAGRQACIT